MQSSSSSTTSTEDILDEYGNSGLRKRRTLYASERPTKQFKTPDASLATFCAHRVALLDSPEQQIRAILQEIRVIHLSAPNKRVKPKIIIFVSNPKSAVIWSKHLAQVGKVGFIHVSDPTTTETVLANFKAGKLSILLTTDDPSTTARLYEERATISAVIGASPPFDKESFLGRCTLAAKAVHGNYGDNALSATFCLRTKGWKLAATLMLQDLRKYKNVIVTANLEPWIQEE